MTNMDIFKSLGGLDPDLVARAAPAENGRKKSRYAWIGWASLAACLCLVVGVACRMAIGMIPNQATDIFRQGTLMEIQSRDELPVQYDGELLAFNLEFENYEFYYKTDGSEKNTEDWYSLLASKGDANGHVLLHCMFGETTVEDWKVSRVFTKKATQTVTINGVNVQLARNELSLDYAYWYYAIFEYDDVVYDIRVKSNDANYVFDVLHAMFREPQTQPVKYTCDLSQYPTNQDCRGYGRIAQISDGKLLIVPGSDQDRIAFGEVVWLVCDDAEAYSVGQVVTYTFRDVKAPDNQGEPLNIIALLVYME